MNEDKAATFEQVLQRIAGSGLEEFDAVAGQLGNGRIFGHAIRSTDENAAASIVYLERLRSQQYPIGQYDTRRRALRDVSGADYLRFWARLTPLLARVPQLRTTFQPSGDFVRWYDDEVMAQHIQDLKETFGLKDVRLSANILRLIHHPAHFAGINEERLKEHPDTLLLITMLYAIGSLVDDLLDDDMSPSLDRFVPGEILDRDRQRELLIKIQNTLILRAYELSERLGGGECLEHINRWFYSFLQNAYLKGKQLVADQAHLTTAELLAIHRTSNGIYWGAPVTLLAKAVGLDDPTSKDLQEYFLAISIASQIGDDVRDVAADLDVSPNVVMASAAEVGEFEELAWAIKNGKAPAGLVTRDLWLHKNFRRAMLIVDVEYDRVMDNANDVRRKRGLQGLPRDLFRWSKLLRVGYFLGVDFPVTMTDRGIP